MLSSQPQAGLSNYSSTRNPRLAKCYARGIQLANGESDRGYAHAMFAECVNCEPGNLAFVNAMLKNCSAQFPKGLPKRWLPVSSTNRAIRKALTNKSWREVIRLGVARLETNPWDVVVLRAMAAACEQLHCNETELAYLRQALDAEPRNIDLNRHCARSLGRMGQFDQAIACWLRIDEMKKGDAEAKRMMSYLCAEKLRYPNGRPPETAASEMHVPSGEPTDEAVSGEILAVRLSARQQLERAIADDPTESSNYVKLAELFAEDQQFRHAIDVLNRGIAACGQENELLECLCRMEACQADHERKLSELRANQAANSKSRFQLVHGVDLALALGFALLVMQILFPSASEALIQSLDCRHWSRATWFSVNIVAVLLLVSIRWWPAIRASLKSTSTQWRRSTS